MTYMDPDAAMAYEFKQQELVKEIVDELYRIADNVDIESDEMYMLGAHYLLELFSAGTHNPAICLKIPFDIHVVAKIEKFTESPTERKWLLYLVFQKFAEGIQHTIFHEYRKTQILAEDAQNAT